MTTLILFKKFNSSLRIRRIRRHIFWIKKKSSGNKKKGNKFELDYTLDYTLFVINYFALLLKIGRCCAMVFSITVFIIPKNIIC